jgi:pyruvate,water dikinase
MSTLSAREPPAPGQLIVPPPNFPLAWEQPDDTHLFWTTDSVHYPDSVTPLEGWFLRNVYERGFNAAAEAYRLPFRLRMQHINTYLYSTVVPMIAPPQPILRVMGWLSRRAPRLASSIQGAALGGWVRRYQAKLNPVLARLADTWAGEWLPEIKAHLAYWEYYDLPGASEPQLLAHLESTIDRTRRLGEIHFLVAFPYMLAQSTFADLYGVLFGNASDVEAYRLLQGFENKTMETNRALWDLSRRALDLPQVRAVLEECATAEVIPALERSAAGQAFLAYLRAYLAEYGQRADKFTVISEPAWIEDPTPVIKNLKDYITQPDRDLAAELRELAAARARHVDQARAHLRGYRRAVVDQFERSLKAAQEANVLQEDHSFWIDYRCLYQVRRVVLEWGRRLAQSGALKLPADVFYLLPDELRATAESATALDRRHLVAGRQAELHYFRTIAPPAALGTPPLAPPPDEPIGRAFGKFFGAPAGRPPEPGVLWGSAGSPGVARGPARVIRSLAEAAKLQRGDVLVAETTAPPWTPLFATAAAVVTDVGGVLSHCAVVAREYHIPAVVGTGAATTVIRDGQILEVDGNVGVVRVVA